MLSYLGDVCPTLTSFLGCYPPAARRLLAAQQAAQHAPAGQAAAHQLLGVLAAMHDKLMPQLARALQQPEACKVR